MIGGNKNRIEVNERKMTDGEKKLFRRAKEAELQSWLDHKVFDTLADGDRVVRVRWALAWNSNAKARLCVLGFQDPDLKDVHRDSPTLCAEAEFLISQCVAWNNLKLVSRNIKTAFLSGDEEHDVRDDPEAQLKLCWWDRMQRSLLSDSHPAN